MEEYDSYEVEEVGTMFSILFLCLSMFKKFCSENRAKVFSIKDCTLYEQ